MDHSRKISGNTLGDNAMLNQGNLNITFNAGKSLFALLGTPASTVAHPLPSLLRRQEKIPSER